MVTALYILIPIGFALLVAAFIEIRCVERRHRSWLRMSAALEASSQEHPLTASQITRFRDGVWEDE